MLKNLELSHENHLELMLCRKEYSIFSTAFDVEGYLLNDLGLSFLRFLVAK
jgi:N-acetylneuraminate synthase/N,N'-diacetyllegionaminate synthase